MKPLTALLVIALNVVMMVWGIGWAIIVAVAAGAAYLAVYMGRLVIDIFKGQ